MWSEPSLFPVVVSAASGTGKTTVVNKLAREFPELFVVSISVTTRPPRGDEVDGVHYHFVTHETFVGLIEAGQLLEWAKVYDHYYGTPLSEVEGAFARGKIPLLDIDVQGGMQIMAQVPGAVSVFLLPPSFEELRRRLHARGTDPEERVARRLECAPEEIRQGLSSYDYVVVNDDVEECVQTVVAIVRAERARSWRHRGERRDSWSFPPMR